MTVQNLYTKYLDGEISKQKFLYEVRRDSNLTMISPSNSFEDVVKILKNKSIISEKASKESKGKQEVEIIAKTIDMVNPYEYTKGMEYELNITDVPATSGDLSEENIAKAQKKVLTNLTKNPRYYSEKMCGKGEVSEEWVEVTKKEIEKIGKGKKNIMRESSKDVISEDIFDFKPGEEIEFINKNNGNVYKGTVKVVSPDKKSFTFIDPKTNKTFNWDGGEDEKKFNVKKIVKEEEEDFELKIPVKKIENLVKLVNSLIEKAFDEDGDPIPVVDTTGTWESPTVYSPIHFDGTNLTIISKEVMGNKEEVDEYEGENLYYDGIPSLNYIGRLYRKALRKNNIQESENTDEFDFGFDDWKYDFDAVNDIERKREKYNNLQKLLLDINKDPEWASSLYTLDGVDKTKEIKKVIINLLKYMRQELEDLDDVYSDYDGMEDGSLTNPETGRNFRIQEKNTVRENKNSTSDKYVVKYSKNNNTYQVWRGEEIITDFNTKERADSYARFKNSFYDLEESIYKKYADKWNKTLDEVKDMVKEAIALKDKAGNIQYAKDSTEASNIEKAAKAKGVILNKTQI